MKKITLTIVLIFLAFFSYAQGTVIGALIDEWGGSNTQNGNIFRSGNVGIGTDNPLNRLQLGNSMSFHDGGHEVLGFGYAAGNTQGTDLNPTGYGSQIRLDPLNGVFSLGVASSLTGNPTSTLFITKENRVGIGTSDPQDDLQIGTGLFLHNAGTQQIGFRFRPEGSVDTDPSRFGASLRFDPNSGQFSMGVSSTISNTPTRILVVNGTGRVGIGTAIPDEKLTVNGSIHAREVRVDLNIPADYVFEKYYTGTSSLKPEYRMPTLDEVEQFTQENNHLPGVPSAREIQEEGLHLKEMTNLLLQKIEELTLYTIRQEKRIKALEKSLGKNN